jgi:hypothetical protein
MIPTRMFSVALFTTAPIQKQQVSIDSEMGGSSVSYSSDGISHSSDKELTAAMKESQIFFRCDSIFMKFQNRQNQLTLMEHLPTRKGHEGDFRGEGRVRCLLPQFERGLS